METEESRHPRVRPLIVCVCLLIVPGAFAADNGVRRQLQQREQQQLELRLKMQQHADRATQSPPNPSADVHQRTLERDQQQRLQQLHEQQLRESAAAGRGPDVQRELERQRASQAGAEELKRFEAERRFESGRGAP